MDTDVFIITIAVCQTVHSLSSKNIGLDGKGIQSVEQLSNSILTGCFILNMLSNGFIWRTFLKTRTSLLSHLLERFDYWKGNYIGKTIRNCRAEPRFAIPLMNVRDLVNNGLPRTITQRKYGITVFNKQLIFIIHHSNPLASFEKNRIKWRSTSQVSGR